MTNYVVAARLRHVVLERDKKSDGIQVERLFSDTGCFLQKTTIKIFLAAFGLMMAGGTLNTFT